MKASIHPTYYPEAKVTCACGNTFTVGSTLPSLEVEVCSACHPFYTGQDKVMDKVGRIQKFRERLAKKETLKPKKPKKGETKKTLRPKVKSGRSRKN
jgi:large subunit ribosomal protein L31